MTDDELIEMTSQLRKRLQKETRMNNLTLLERETIINYNQAEAVASVFASDPALMRRLDKLCEEQPENAKLLRRGDDWAEYEVPKKWVKINPPPKRAPLTEEQKAVVCERLKLAHKKRLKKG